MSRFRTIEFLAASTAPTQKEIRAIEEALSASLPKDFKVFLHDANGTTLPYALYVATEEVRASLAFEWVLDAHNGYDDSILVQLPAVRARWPIPRQVLPFARDCGSSFACLDLRPETYGAVVALLDPDEFSLGTLKEPPFVQVAPSFLDYIDRLVPELSDAAFGIDEEDAPEET